MSSPLHASSRGCSLKPHQSRCYQPPMSQPCAQSPTTITDRHVDLCLALIENPDQPQTVFVKRFHVHPNTVRQTRRELEEAGEFPVLTHWHGRTGQRRAQLAEAVD